MNNNKFIPFGEYILVKPFTMDNVTKSGFFIPQVGSREKNSQLVEVIELGEGKIDDKGNKIPFRVKVGDVLIIKKYMAVEHEQGQEIFTIIDEDSILGFMRSK